MHQEHNIPWNKLASNYKLVRDNPHFTPRATGLWLCHRPSQQEDLKYFERTFAQNIRTFADTERKKYDSNPRPTADGHIFPNALRESHRSKTHPHVPLNEILNSQNQRLRYWEHGVCVSCNQPDDEAPRLSYSNSGDHDHLAIQIELLILTNHLTPLLILARTHTTPIHTLTTIGQSWNHGFSRLMYSALFSYIFINLAAAMGVLDDGRYLETSAYEVMVRSMEADRGVPAIGEMYERYLEKVDRDPVWDRPMLHRDYKALKEYMKVCFAILYRYDLVLRECGAGPDWEEEIRNILCRMGRAWW